MLYSITSFLQSCAAASKIITELLIRIMQVVAKLALPKIMGMGSREVQVWLLFGVRYLFKQI